MKVHITNYAQAWKNALCESQQFIYRDKKDRNIGASVSLLTFESIEAPEDVGSWWDLDQVGTLYAFRSTATRNGKPYGAIQRLRFFKTEAEREAAVRAYFRDAVKRAAKTGSEAP